MFHIVDPFLAFSLYDAVIRINENPDPSGSLINHHPFPEYWKCIT